MKSILLVGLGRFGRHIAEKLNELDHQVMALVTNGSIPSTRSSFLSTAIT